MHTVEPKVFILGETKINQDEVKAYLKEIGAPNWKTDAPSELEELVEISSRSCYMSFRDDDGKYPNPNLSRSREGNDVHLAHILDVGHGSVMEHSMVNFAFTNVSRIFTHELVRHKVGTAVSQESLRFVRLDDIGVRNADCWDEEAKEIFEEAIRASEEAYQKLLKLAAKREGADSFDILPFTKKKIYTSAARRVAPEGLATNITWSCNIRALRHVLEMRTDPAAEEEIRQVFDIVGLKAMERWPNLFGDYEPELVNGYYHFVTKHRKV